MDLSATAPSSRGAIARFFDSDVWYSFKTSPLAVLAAVVSLIYFVAAALAPWIAPQNPFDPAAYDLMDSLLPPMTRGGSGQLHILGTDDLGRDVFSAILFGARISLTVGFCSVLFAASVGVILGLVSGFVGGIVDAVIMRIADVQLSFPAILIALLIDGVMRLVIPHESHNQVALLVVIVAIGLSKWVQYARTVRGSTMVERNLEYVQAARVTGVHPLRIMFGHILTNVMGPVLVIATIGLALAIITEATLSFLGVGVPPTQPSLGTLIRIGNEYLFSGEWWVTIFPSLALVFLVLAVNLLGDWLRDTLNPRLR
ncbi:MAG: ABC transporter permease [Alphaproteobacteria bacterium]|nr:ABC transporter permease [Alphaproteobacteria bacterium]